MWDGEFGRRVRAASAQKKDACGDNAGSDNGSGTGLRNSRARGRAQKQSAQAERAGAVADKEPRPSGSKRSARRLAPSAPRGKPKSQKPPLPPLHRTRRQVRSPAKAPPELPEPAETRAKAKASHPYQRRTKHKHGNSDSGDDDNDDDGEESPTLHIPSAEVAASAVGVVTRSMARRLQAQEHPHRSGGSSKPPLISQSSTASEVTVGTASAPLSRTHSSVSADEEGGQLASPPRTEGNFDTPENHYRHAPRSPQFNYDRFIPTRSSDTTVDLRRYEKGHRASSPVFLRRAHNIEHKAQVEEANRTYDALLRSELLNDRPTVDALSPSGRIRSSSPQPQPISVPQGSSGPRPTSRRELYNLSSSPNQLPSLVPWSGGPGSSSRPTTPPSSPPRAAPVFMYRSPRKASLGTPSSMPGLGQPYGRNLFGRASPVHEVYQQSSLSKEARRILSPRQAPRRIPKDPVKVLDAPGIRDDYYLNLMDWSTSDRVSVALNSEVYIWDAKSSQTSRLCDVNADNNGDWVTSVGWAENGKHLAVGLNSGLVQIWDVNRGRRIRSFSGHTRRVGAVHWNQAVVSTGGRDKRIYNYDTRLREGAVISTYYGHSQEVCGLRWSPDKVQLASGGNDNQLLIWDTRFTPLDSRVSSYHPEIAPGARAFRRPLFRLTEHSAAVKALSWSPTQGGLLASGGGTEDRCIRLWDTQTGRQVSSHDTRSQVCNLSWSHDGTELVSTHGYSENHVIVWKYPAMQPISVLAGHTRRVLYLAHSPDGQTIATAAGDETIRFWEIFPKDIAPELGALPASMARFVRTPGRVSTAAVATVGDGGVADSGGVMLDDLAHIR
ncbi:substrate-specific activator of APC-dependent proteolysis [Coemansia sp. RSA 552]|nr:substrate-specific activator of APC-dependent proteolysis [Coemansia sp. RSA 552]